MAQSEIATTMVSGIATPPEAAVLLTGDRSMLTHCGELRISALGGR
jgi:hypothetical protein